MHQPEDDDEGEVTTNAQANVKTKRNNQRKTASMEQTAYCGMRKGFLAFGATEKCSPSKLKTSDRKSSPEKHTEGNAIFDTIQSISGQQVEKEKTRFIKDDSKGDNQKNTPSSSSQSLFTKAKTSDPGNIYGQNWKFSDLEYQLLYESDEVKECAFNWEKCTKDPGHVGFIPLPEFSLQHLPQRFQSEDILNLIKAVADLTVRLRVTFSPNRPRDEKTAKSVGFTGSACVRTVIPRDKDCPCTDCKTHGYKNKKWWDICLYTAAHCINDTFEANNVKIDFFYDSKECQKKGDVKTLYGVRDYGRNEDWDGCVALLATHDDELGRRLRQAYDQYISILKRFQSKPSTPSAVSEKKVMVMVSHPHGQPKMVTVGEFRGQYDVTLEDPKPFLLAKHLFRLLRRRDCEEYWVEYTTKSCSGSSGSSVLCLDDVTSGDRDRQLSSYYTHCRANLSTGCNVGGLRTFTTPEHHPLNKKKKDKYEIKQFPSLNCSNTKSWPKYYDKYK